jgi:hypothetical protein
VALFLWVAGTGAVRNANRSRCRTAVRSPQTKRPPEGGLCICDCAVNQARRSAGPLLLRRYAMKARPTKPRIIMAQVEGSGTAAVSVVLPPIEPNNGSVPLQNNSNVDPSKNIPEGPRVNERVPKLLIVPLPVMSIVVGVGKDIVPV